jgi:hypothetical protein
MPGHTEAGVPTSTDRRTTLLYWLVLVTLLCVLVLSINVLVLSSLIRGEAPANSSNPDDGYQILEVKMVLVDNANFPKQSAAIEAVGTFLINGGIDYNNRQYKFRKGEVVVLEAIEEMYGYRFAFWQKDEPRFSGIIVTNRTLTVVMSEHQVWWINYAR